MMSTAATDRIRFEATPLEGAWLLEPVRFEDERGWFGRLRCETEFTSHGLEAHFVQTSISVNLRRGILRGMHFQVPPCDEVKLVRCIRGSIQDVIIDLRPGSKTYLKYFSVRLDADDFRGLYVPRGFAHGFLALEDDSEVLYEISQYHSPSHARGVRWDDPVFGISWEIDDPILLPRDRDYPDFDPNILS